MRTSTLAVSCSVLMALGATAAPLPQIPSSLLSGAGAGSTSGGGSSSSGAPTTAIDVSSKSSSVSASSSSGGARKNSTTGSFSTYQRAAATTQTASGGGPSAAGNATTTSSGGAAAGGTPMPIWQRPDRNRFGDKNAPFIAIGATEADWYTVSGTDGATTVAATKVTKLPEHGETGTVGDVLIMQSGIVAEAIGRIQPDGSNGDLFDIIACNAQDAAAGKCILVDYDGTNVRSTDTATVTGTTSTFSIKGPAPTPMVKWIENAMTLDLITKAESASRSVFAASAPGANATSSINTNGTTGTTTTTSSSSSSSSSSSASSKL